MARGSSAALPRVVVAAVVSTMEEAKMSLLGALLGLPAPRLLGSTACGRCALPCYVMLSVEMRQF